jgi:hypothetical protein
MQTKNKLRAISLALSVILPVFLVGAVVLATSTISDDIDVGDALTVAGATTLNSTFRVPEGTTYSATGTNPGRQIYLVYTTTAVAESNQLQGMQLSAIANLAADTGANAGVTGIEVKAKQTTDNAYTVGQLRGVVGNVDAKNATVTTAWALEGAIDVSSGGTITTAAGLHINVNNSGTITNDYGIYIDVPNAAVDDLTADIYKNANGHLNIKTNPSYPARNVRINSQTYTTDASIIGLLVKPRAGVELTNRIAGIEVSPGINDSFAGTSVSGIISNPLLKGTTGDLSGEMRAFEGKVESDTGSTRTVTGPVSVFQANQAMHGTVTNGVYVMDVNAGGGNVAWSGFALLPDDDQVASKDASWTDDGAGVGWIKVKVDDTVGYIKLYDAVD